MDRRTIIAVVLSLGIYYAWLAWRGPQQPPGEPAPGDAPLVDAPAPAAPAPAVEAPTGPAEILPFEVCGTTLGVSTDGGAITDVVLPDVAGPYAVTAWYEWIWGRISGSIEGPWLPYGPDPGPAHLLTPLARAVEVGVGADAAPPRLAVVTRDATSITLEGASADGLRVRHELKAGGEPCVLDVRTSFTNPGDAPIATTVSWSVLDHTGAEGGRQASQHQPTAVVDGSLYYGGALGAGCVRAGTKLSDDSGPIPLPGPVSWFGVSDRYFGFYLLPGSDVGGELRFQRLGAGDDALDGGVLAKAITLPPGATQEWTGRVYTGENHLATLTAVDATLDRVVDLGWFAMFGYPLLLGLRVLHGALGGWGLAIIGVTVVLKILFFPLTWRAMKSGQSMQLVQPEIAKLREQYADDPQELNRRTLELMSTHGVNPLSGCWPMLVQMPVFVALYNVLLTNVEFYQEPFLWLRDLSSPDPYSALPIAVTALMWGQQQLTPTPENMDPAQQAVLKWMPLLFGLFFFTSPSGLAIYVLVNVTLSIGQQVLIKRSLGAGPAKVPAKAGP
jgi:YidC/Oxa1 family membrane protein insertase